MKLSDPELTLSVIYFYMPIPLTPHAIPAIL